MDTSDKALGFFKWLFGSACLIASFSGVLLLIAYFNLNGPFITAALLPFTVLVLAFVILNPAKRFVSRHMSDSKLKSILLRRIN
ncbi:hypothetical protein [Porticoccus sp.]